MRSHNTPFQRTTLRRVLPVGKKNMHQCKKVAMIKIAPILTFNKNKYALQPEAFTHPCQ